LFFAPIEVKRIINIVLIFLKEKSEFYKILLIINVNIIITTKVIIKLIDVAAAAAAA
jgi:hypothetical protein